MRELLNRHLYNETLRRRECSLLPTHTSPIDTLITRQYTSLTRSQQLLADYVLQYTAEAALMSSKEIAQRLHVSEATVVRFAQQLGFEGYPQFRQMLQRQLLSDIRSSVRVASLLNDEDTKRGPLHQMVSSTIQQLQLLVQNIPEQELTAVVNTVTQARRIYIFGEGALATPTVQLGFWLNRLGCNVHVINQTGRRFFESIVQAGEGDVGLIFAFRRIGPEGTALIEQLHSRAGSPILFTDIANSPLHSLSSNVLRIFRGPMDTFRPLGAVTTVCDALILGVMLAKGDDGVRELEKLDDLRQRYGFL